MRIKSKLWVTCVMVMAVKGLCAQNNPDVINSINTSTLVAISEMQRTGVPASITLAQGIHESEAGTSDLVKRSNNHFGIKCKEDWTGNVVYHDDDSRGECFRSYASAEDSYRDHSDFLRKGSRYAFLFDLDPTDYEGWANGLHKAGYATNIRYSQILIKLISDYNLEQYTLIAMGKMKPDTSVTGAVIVSAPSAADYPTGEFQINRARVIFGKAGISLLSIADQYNLPLARLLEYNDLKDQDVLAKDQLIFLQRKRKTGSNEFHITREGESLYDICQTEGIRLQDLLEMNRLSAGVQPVAGDKLYLQSPAPARTLVNNGRNTN